MMENTFIEYSEAICYSGFRQGQGPDRGIFPTYNEIKEDLVLLQKRWNYIRLYDCDQHAATCLKVIQNEGLNIKVMLGAYINAEVNNFNCPWGGGVYSEEQLTQNKKENDVKIDLLIEMANQYPDIIAWLSAGNEATVDWTDHMVPEVRVIEMVEKIKSNCTQKVTFCENYHTWIHKLGELAKAVDFISIHTYPVWEYKNIDEAMAYTIENFNAVSEKYPNKTVIITEAGWTTKSNGRGIEPSNVNEEIQREYLSQLEQWSKDSGTITFLFEAFDEDWKGDADEFEPEKHWGIYKIDRSPKLYAQP